MESHLLTPVHLLLGGQSTIGKDYSLVLFFKYGNSYEWVKGINQEIERYIFMLINYVLQNL